MTIAYLANRFPEPVESYIGEEICELRRHGRQVVPCSVLRPSVLSLLQAEPAPGTRYLFPLRLLSSVKATWLCVHKFGLIADLVGRAVRGPEPVFRRCHTLVHAWLGAYLAVLLKKDKVHHLHVHHGYFAAWVGMVAARLLGAGFSMTLHGSDLLVRADYLEAKLADCRFCITVSEFNRRYIAELYPQVNPKNVLVRRLGVDLDFWRPQRLHREGVPFSILSVGRLHPAKNFGFLLLACAALKADGVAFRCVIAGDGPERGTLEQLIAELGLGREVTLRGHVLRKRLPELYAAADVVVLTSRSEGLPVTLMEAMAMERVVLAPNITGIPELVGHGETGFLYTPNSMEDFLAKLQGIRVAGPFLELRQAARRRVDRYFNSRLNLAGFAACFLQNSAEIDRLAFAMTTIGPPRKEAHENSLLQQVQLRVQRDRNLPV